MGTHGRKLCGELNSEIAVKYGGMLAMNLAICIIADGDFTIGSLVENSRLIYENLLDKLI